MRTVLITTQMKPMGYSDEFILAFTLPDLVYDLLAGGAIAAAFIPTLSTYLTKGKERVGWKAISTFMNLSVVILILLEIVFLCLPMTLNSFAGIQGDRCRRQRTVNKTNTNTPAIARL